jgi:non-specific protein-tyrosine kinase
VLPQHTRDLMLGLLIGLVLGIGAVTLLEQLDIRVHSQDEFAEGTGMPMLGRLPRVGKEVAKDASLLVLDEPDGPTAEAFRMLRGNLDFINVDGEIQSIMVSSPSQGEGKSTTVCNLAVTLARTGKHVIVVDCDLRRPRVHHYFGMKNRHGVSTVVTGHASVGDALQVVRPPAETASEPARPSEGRGGSLRVLTSGPLPPNPGEIVTSRSIATLIQDLTTQSDLVLVDAPPFLAVGDAAALSRAVGGIMVVMRLGTITKTMLKETADFLEPLPCRKLGIVATNLPTEGAGYRYEYRRAKAEEEPATPSSLTAPDVPVAP